MGIAPIGLRSDYWLHFDIRDEDLEFIYNHLLEIETPLTSNELVRVLISARIQTEKLALQNQQTSAGSIYQPKEHYQVGQAVQFPGLDWKNGKVISTRPGINPDIPPFEVINVELETGETHSYAAGFEDHILNQPLSINLDDPQLDSNTVYKTHGRELSRQLTANLEANPDLVQIAGRWFPRALLVDISIGHLNLAEAILEVEGGGPLTTKALMEQLDLPTDVNSKLTEFSLNLALQEDDRFDEVGPSGKILWYLHRLEPESVQQTPQFLRYNSFDYDQGKVAVLLDQFEGKVADELENCISPSLSDNEASIALIYPHFRVGTLPICDQLIKFFPTAYESPRVQFTFVDGDTGEKFAGWVVRSQHYVFGLRDWYLKNNLNAGSIVTILASDVPGEVIIKSGKRRPFKDSIRTALIGSDGGIVFALLKHSIASTIDERMTIMISDSDALDKIWEQNAKQRTPLAQTVKSVMRELAKLSPQGHVHAQELYAAVNVIRRCPPGPILSILIDNPWAVHMGDLYFRLNESAQETRA
jgi:hypothetical protein